MTLTTKPHRQHNVRVEQRGIMNPIFWWLCGDCGEGSILTVDDSEVERWADNHRCAAA